MRDFTRTSRFILYDNSAFVLEYAPTSSTPGGTYAGQYRVEDGGIGFLFQFQGRHAEDGWDDATATLSDGALFVSFDDTMQHSDFENAAYALAR